MAAIDELFQLLAEQGASDLHLSEGLPPILRVHGRLQHVGGMGRLNRKTMTRYLREICSEEGWKTFAHAGEYDFAYAPDDATMRLRANFFLKETGLGAVFRVIPTEVLSLDKLGAPKLLRELAELDRGLCLVTGPTGSGKSTTLAAMIDHINRTQSKRILTVEDPIEFIHQNHRSIVVQRELRVDTPSFRAALRHAPRMDFDVILVGEMRDFETIEAAITAAELGSLVFGTLHTNSAPKAIDRIIDVFPARQQDQVRGQLAESLRAVCAQTLLRKAGGRGRVAAHELLVQTPAVRMAIREGRTASIISAMQSGRALGMQLLDDRIEELLQADQITAEEAYAKAADKARFRAGSRAAP